MIQAQILLPSHAVTDLIKTYGVLEGEVLCPLLLAYDDTYLFIGQKNGSKDCKFTSRIPYEKNSVVLEGTNTLMGSHWEVDFMEFKEVWLSHNFKKKDTATLMIEVLNNSPKPKVSLSIQSAKAKTHTILKETDERVLYNLDSLQLKEFVNQEKWMHAIEHAKSVIELEEESAVVVDPFRFAILAKKQIYYYITPTPIDHWVVSNNILLILSDTIKGPIKVQQKNEQLFFYEVRDGYDLLYHIILSPDQEVYPIERVDFHLEYQSAFEIDANYVMRYLGNLKNVVRVETVQDGEYLKFIPHVKTELKEVTWDTPLEEMDVVLHIYNAIELLILEKEAQERFIDWTQLKKEVNTLVNRFKKEHEKSILKFAEKYVASSDKKVLMKVFTEEVKKVKESLYRPYQQKEVNIPIHDVEGRISDSIFDIDQLKTFFSGKDGLVKVERRLYTNVYHQVGYLWVHQTNELMQCLAGYTKPDAKLIKKLIDNGTLYDYVDRNGNLTILDEVSS
ncbi:hypothetical protein bcgnr5390_16130 [Bacillus luti]|nr:hypothetical protein BC2903_53390 [Bacillus cereus]